MTPLERSHVSLTLDVFKGIAAVAMVLNHAGFALLSPANTATGGFGLAVFLGGMAPVLFFFATGFGLGLRPSGRAVDWPATLKKVAWLVMADQCLLWMGGRSFGLDFFGFIALSMLIGNWLSERRSPVRWCLSMLVLILAMRFGLPSLRLQFPMDVLLLRWFTGLGGVVGVSYPFSPWAAAPLAGFLCARLMSASSGVGGRCDRPVQLLWLASVLAGVVAVWLYHRGVSFHRYGHVAAGFVVAAVPVVAGAWALASLLARTPFRMGSFLALRGTSALLVVPLHYAALAVLVQGLGLRQLPPSQAVGWIVMLVVGSLTLSQVLAGPLERGFRWLTVPVLSLALAGVAWVAWAWTEPVWVPRLACCLGIVLVATRFGRR